MRIRRGADPDLIIRLPDGTHAAVAMSLTDYAGSAGGDPTAIPLPWLDIHGLRQAAQWIAHRRQAGCFPVPTVTPSPPGSNSLPCDHPERSSHERARLGSGFPKSHPQVWTELTVEHQRRAIQLIAQLAVKLALTLATSPPAEIGHDQPNAG